MQKPHSDPGDDPLFYRGMNAEELSLNLMRLFEQSGRVMTEFVERADAKMGPYSAATEISEATNTLSDLTRMWLSDPGKFAEAQGTLMRSYADLWNNTVQRMLGLEVEGVEDPAKKLGIFSVAKVLEAGPHPDADKLQVLKVEALVEGEVKQLQVVCGAPNARAGMTGIFAPPGATIPVNGMVLKPTKIRGVESNGCDVTARTCHGRPGCELHRRQVEEFGRGQR